MQLVYDVVQNVMVFVIWMSLVNHLLEKSSFGKYIRFFLGLLFLLVVISPVVEAFAGENPIQMKLDLSFLDEKRLDVQEAMELADKKTAQKMEVEYENAMVEQIQMLLGNEVTVKSVDAGFSQEFEQLLEVKAVLGNQMEEEAETVSEETAKDASEESVDAKVDAVKIAEIEKVAIGQKAESQDLQNEEGEEVEKERKTQKQGEYIERIAAYYGLEETSVTLEWK